MTLSSNNKPFRTGIFIAFEGIDGCGKSTQIKKLVQYIFEKDKHHHIVLTRNPYKDTNIRAILTQDSDPLSQADKLAELFINDRRKQVEELILPNLEKGHFVVTDRYKFSTIAYQSAQGIPMENLIKKQNDLPIPEITFIIDISPEKAMERMKKDSIEIRGKEHKFEAHLDFISKLRENYLKAAEIQKQKGEKIFIINGERSPEEVFQEIKGIFDEETEKLKTLQAANILFYDSNGNILLQNRKGISKWGEEYHFFGGHVEDNETPEQALKREIKEELGIELEGHKLFKKWTHYSKQAGCNYETFVYIAPMPKLEGLKAEDGKLEILRFKDAEKFNMINGYVDLIKEIEKHVNNQLTSQTQH